MNTESHGTRAKGTDSLVYRVLSSESYRTLEIVERFMLAALVGQTVSSDISRRSQNILDRIAKYGESAIPKDELDLVAWSDLAVSGSAVKRAGKTTPRQFKKCLGCERKFLAKRANNLTCSTRCRARVSRVSQIGRNTLSEAA
jgi:hypothetical protein